MEFFDVIISKVKLHKSSNAVSISHSLNKQNKHEKTFKQENIRLI